MTDLTEQIIAILRRDGRASYSKIARELNSNRELVASRINPLVESGKLRIITGVHPRILGLTVWANLRVKVGGNVRRVVDAINTFEAPDFISVVVGSFQVVIEMQLRDMTELRREVAAIRAIEGVREVDVLLYESVLESFFVGAEPRILAAELDAADIAIITRLANDGRANLADIAKAVGLSLSGCRTRIQRLLAANVMRIGAIKERVDMTNDLVFGVGANIRGDDTQAVELLRAQSGLEFLGRTVGRFDLLATMGFDSLHDFYGFISRLRSLPSVTDCEQWLHVSLVREQYQRTLKWLKELGIGKTRLATAQTVAFKGGARG